MIVGFTGTQQGMTEAQRVQFTDFMTKVATTGEFHHGDCIGADAQAHEIVRELGWTVYLHPPTDPKKRANKVGDWWARPKPYLDRNHNIVDMCEMLVACPKGPEEIRSGTWSTVRYARKTSRLCMILWPNGDVSK